MSGRRAIHGLHAVTAALKRRPEAVFEVFLDPGRNDPRARRVADLARAGGVRVHHADATRLDGLAKGSRHQGVVAFVEEAASAGSLEEVLESAAEPPLLLTVELIGPRLDLRQGSVEYFLTLEDHNTTSVCSKTINQGYRDTS